MTKQFLLSLFMILPTNLYAANPANPREYEGKYLTYAHSTCMNVVVAGGDKTLIRYFTDNPFANGACGSSDKEINAIVYDCDTKGICTPREPRHGAAHIELLPSGNFIAHDYYFNAQEVRVNLP